MGRFINADANISTGQGLISNNTFTYCLNNPINRTDFSGTVSLWYFLIVDSDMGFIHRCVQMHIVATYGISLRKEVVLGGHGRADIVDIQHGTVWEVKHAAQDPVGRAILATTQARGYIGGIQGTTTITGLGAEGAFSGVFYLQCENYYYEVEYKTPQKGAILYTVKEVPNYEGSVYRVFVPKASRVEKPSLVTTTVGLIGVSICGGGGGGRYGLVHSKVRDAAYVY